MDTADERDAKRSAIAATHADQRDAREKQFVQDRVALEDDFHSDIEAIRVAQEEAFVAAGLNPDGTDPLGRELGSTV